MHNSPFCLWWKVPAPEYYLFGTAVPRATLEDRSGAELVTDQVIDVILANSRVDTLSRVLFVDYLLAADDVEIYVRISPL